MTLKLSMFLVFFTSIPFNNILNTIYVCKGKYSEKYHYITDTRGFQTVKAVLNKLF